MCCYLRRYYPTMNTRLHCSATSVRSCTQHCHPTEQCHAAFPFLNITCRLTYPEIPFTPFLSPLHATIYPHLPLLLHNSSTKVDNQIPTTLPECPSHPSPLSPQSTQKLMTFATPLCQPRDSSIPHVTTFSQTLIFLLFPLILPASLFSSP